MAGTASFASDFTQKSPLGGSERVLIDGSLKYCTVTQIAALAALAPTAVQTVSAHPDPHVVLQAIVVVEDGGIGNVDLILPEAVAGSTFWVLDARTTGTTPITLYRAISETLNGVNTASHVIVGSDRRVHSAWRITAISGTAWEINDGDGDRVRVITGDATIDEDDRFVIIDASGTVDVTLPAARAKSLHTFYTTHGSGQTITFIRDGGTGTINGAAASYVLSTGGVRQEVTFVGLDAGEWTTDNGVFTFVALNVPPLAQRVTELEAPTYVDTTATTSSPQTWTTAKAYRATDNTRTLACAVLLDEDLVTTAQWPIGESRELSKYNTSVYGLQINVGSTDTLNGGAAGTGSGVITGSTAVPGPTVARFTVTITRDGTNAWSWK